MQKKTEKRETKDERMARIARDSTLKTYTKAFVLRGGKYRPVDKVRQDKNGEFLVWPRDGALYFLGPKLVFKDGEAAARAMGVYKTGFVVASGSYRADYTLDEVQTEPDHDGDFELTVKRRLIGDKIDKGAKPVRWHLYGKAEHCGKWFFSTLQAAKAFLEKKLREELEKLKKEHQERIQKKADLLRRVRSLKS
jgi:hypothetical protein